MSWGAAAASYVDSGGGGSGATPTFVAASTKTGNASSTTVSAPAGIQAGDVLIMVASSYYDPNLPTGWTAISAGTGTGGGYAVHSRACYKVAAAGDVGATYTVTFAGGDEFTISVLAYRGCSATAPIDVSAARYSTSSAGGLVAPTVTTTGPNRRLVYGFTQESAAGNLVMTVPTPPVQRTSIHTGAYNTQATADEELAVAGTSTARSANISGAESNAEFTIALKP